MKLHLLVLIVLSFILQACGGGGSGGAGLPPGKDVTTSAFETYRTDHDGRNRVRSRIAVSGEEAAALTAFDTSGSGPAGYLSLIDLRGTPYAGQMTIEAIGAVDTGSGKTRRLLRLTADQAAFVNERNGAPIAATGKYHFRGTAYSWVTIDNGPLLSGYHAQGLEDLVIDFDTETASVNLRTEVAAGSEVEITLSGSDLPFNIRNGAWGGDVTIAIRDPNSPMQGSIDGVVRGNIGGAPEFANSQHGMTTSGLYTGSGTIAEGGTDHRISVDGVFFGRDPNATP